MNLNKQGQLNCLRFPTVVVGLVVVGLYLQRSFVVPIQTADEKADEVHQEEGLELVAHQPPVQEEGTNSTPSPQGTQPSSNQVLMMFLLPINSRKPSYMM